MSTRAASFAAGRCFISSFRVLCASAAVLCAIGCGGTPTDQAAKGATATQTSPDPTYPKGPYGYQVNDIIADFMLFGRHNTSLTGSLLDQPMQDIWLSSYRKNYKAIVVAAAAEWCVPCNDEAPELQYLYQSCNQNGDTVAFLEALVQSEDGTPANAATITRWVDKHGITFDMAIDPTGVLQPYYDIQAFPMGMVVQSSDMEILFEENGAAPSDIMATLNSTLGPSSTCALPAGS